MQYFYAIEMDSLNYQTVFSGSVLQFGKAVVLHILKWQLKQRWLFEQQLNVSK